MYRGVDSLVHVIVVANEKGGIGKTTIACKLASLLSTDSHEKVEAKYKRTAEKVLLVDTDLQGNATFFTTRQLRSQFEGRSLIEAIAEEDATDYIIELTEHLHVLPSSSKVAMFDAEFTKLRHQLKEPAKWLQRTLAPVAHNYDWIVIDTSPSLTELQLQTFNVSFGGYTNVLIPMQTERFGFHSVQQFSDTLTPVEQHTNPNLAVLGVVPVLTDGTLVDKNIMAEAKEQFGDLLFKTVIKRRAGVKKMVDTGFSEHYAKEREALQDFYDLLLEVKQHV